MSSSSGSDSGNNEILRYQERLLSRGRLFRVQVQEVSVSAAIQSLYSEEDFMDVTLEGNDGFKVKANRAFLAARSNVFRRMLYGEFSEANGGSTVRFAGYPGTTLEVIVKYIFLNEYSYIPPFPPTEPEQEVRSIFDVAEAALFFALPGLCRKMKDTAIHWIRKEPKLAGFFLAAYRSLPPETQLTNWKIDELALKIIKKDPTTTLHTDVLATLSAEILEDLIQDEDMRASELALFHIIKDWAGALSDTTSEDDSSQGQPQPNNQERIASAKHFTKYINLQYIDPQHLTTVVASSGLVSQSQLFEAYRKQAIAGGNESYTAMYTTIRPKQNMWGLTRKKSFMSVPGDDGCITKLLDHPPITSKKVQWTIRIDKLGSKPIALGIAWTGRRHVLSETLEDLIGGWAYTSDGIARRHMRNATRQDLLNVPSPFHEGDTVTFTLDLKDIRGAIPVKNGFGTLSASVNGGTEVKLFSNLLGFLCSRHPPVMGLEQAYDNGFVPAATLTDAATIQLLKIEDLTFR